MQKNIILNKVFNIMMQQTLFFITFLEKQIQKNTKISIKRAPGGRFEHLGVETGWKIHARHDGHSEIIN